MTKLIARKRRAARILLLAVAASISAMSLAQTNAASASIGTQAETTAIKLPKFDVTSVRPDKSEGRSWIQFTADGLSATNVTLQLLIREAYGLNDDQILGAPSWIELEKFDVEARVNDSDVAALQKLTFDQRRSMWQPLLADRFNLKVHREPKELPIYELAVAKKGPSVKQSKPDDTYPKGLKDAGGHPIQGLSMTASGMLTGQAVSMETLASSLSLQLGRTVVDKTGLAGTYDFNLQWTPDASAAESSTAGPSIFSALEEQLGLKLQPAKGPVACLVIDHIEHPNGN